MSLKTKVEHTSMASLEGQASESIVIHLANLRKSCTITISDDIISKIRSIKEASTNSETNDSSLSWRKTQTKSNEWRSGQYRPAHRMQQQQSQQQQPANNHHANGGGSHQRYVSRFKNSTSPVEERILNQVILNKLNKFSEVNYEEIKQFLKQILDSDDTVFLKEFMQLVFRKAASEPVFCPLYAQLICELSSQYKSLLREFDTLYGDYMVIFEEIDESKCPNYETFIKRNREKQYRLGYSQFLAELISKGVLQSDNLILLFSKILEEISNMSHDTNEKSSTVDEYIQCVLRMTKALKDTTMVQNIQCFEEPIEYLLQNQKTEFPGLSKKSVFGLMDCLDIIRNNKTVLA
jgi:hypothetical protein